MIILDCLQFSQDALSTWCPAPVSPCHYFHDTVLLLFGDRGTGYPFLMCAVDPYPNVLEDFYLFQIDSLDTGVFWLLH